VNEDGDPAADGRRAIKAAVLHAPGDLRVKKVARSETGSGEVLAKVGTAGVFGSDIRRVMVTGAYRFPTIPGHEFAGTVEDVGAGVTPRSPTTGWRLRP